MELENSKRKTERKSTQQLAPNTDEILDCIPPGVLVPDFPLVVLYRFVLLMLQSVRLFPREEEEEESASVDERIKE